MSGPLFFSVLTALSVMALFFAARQLLAPARGTVEARMEAYGLTPLGEPVGSTRGRREWALTNRLIQWAGWGPRLAAHLMRADLPFTAAEYTLIVLGAAVLGYGAGLMVGSLTVGLLLALLGGVLPLWYLRFREGRRRAAFVAQLPEILTLLVGGLRAGYGLAQAMNIVVERMAAPASEEFARVVRAVGFGYPLQDALREMAARIDVDDLDMVVTAITVQYELGGNLAQTLDTIGETVRERLRIFREIRTLTAHQRFTATVLALEPVALALLFYVSSPEHIGKLFAPGWIRLLPLTALLMMAFGTYLMRRIVDIKV